MLYFCKLALQIARTEHISLGNYKTFRQLSISHIKRVSTNEFYKEEIGTRNSSNYNKDNLLTSIQSRSIIGYEWLWMSLRLWMILIESLMLFKMCWKLFFKSCFFPVYFCIYCDAVITEWGRGRSLSVFLVRLRLCLNMPTRLFVALALAESGWVRCVDRGV